MKMVFFTDKSNAEYVPAEHKKKTHGKVSCGEQANGRNKQYEFPPEMRLHAIGRTKDRERVECCQVMCKRNKAGCNAPHGIEMDLSCSWVVACLACNHV